MHDAASKFHPDQRLPVLHLVIAIVGIDRRSLQEVGFLQRCLEMFDVALIGSRCLLGQNQTILVSCRMALVAEVELSHLLAPPSLSVHIGHDNFLEHGFFRGPLIFLVTILYHLILLPVTGSIRDTCANDGTALDDNTFHLKLVVDFIQDHVVQVGLYQCVSETSDSCAVGSSIFYAQIDEAAEGEMVVHLVLNLTITQPILCMQKFGLE